MKKFIISVLLVMLVFVFTKESYAHKAKACPSGDEVFCLIRKKSPTLKKGYVRVLSRFIRKSSRKHEIPALLLTAIIGAESSFRMGVTRDVCKDDKCVPKDLGLTQINIVTVKAYNFDRDKLLYDLSYSVDAGAEVLSWFKGRYESEEKYWWARYNCGVRSWVKKEKVWTKSIKRETCQRYIKAVKRWM